jgi:hypothetical protein
MSNTNTGGPAFPSAQLDTTTLTYKYVEGMTLRDIFAAKAMQGLLASLPSDTTLYDSNVAKWSYEMADAMLRAREEI